jgi:hypothetical protein
MAHGKKNIPMPQLGIAAAGPADRECVHAWNAQTSARANAPFRE